MKKLHVTKWGNFCSCEFKHKSTHMLHLCINTETYTNTMSVQETSDGALHSAVGKCMTHTHSSCVDTYSRYRFTTLDGQKRSPAHLHTLWYQIFPLYHLLWSTPTISFWLNGCYTHTRSLSVETNTVRRWTSLCFPLKMGSERLSACKAPIHHCQ